MRVQLVRFDVAQEKHRLFHEHSLSVSNALFLKHNTLITLIVYRGDGQCTVQTILDFQTLLIFFFCCFVPSFFCS